MSLLPAASAQRWIEARHQPGWDRDTELATALGAQLRTLPPALLRHLSVDLAELAGILEPFSS